jgi:hypothetical protein
MMFWFCHLKLLLVLFTGGYLKGKSYKMAKEDGIDVNNF